MQIQENLHVPTCYPGVVYVRGEQKRPARSKWDTVVVDKNDVLIDWHCARIAKHGYTEKPVRVVGFRKQDLDDLYQPDEPRWTHALVGIGCSGARPMVSASTNYNRAKALCGRVFRKDPAEKLPAWGRGPSPGVWKWAEEFIPELLPAFEAPRMSIEEWLDSMPSRRRKILRVAAARYWRAGWRESHRKFKAFLKTELLPGFAKRGGDLIRLDEMIDRMIQGPNDVTHVIAGPYLKPLLHKLKLIWNCDDGPIFYGSSSPEALHKFLQKLEQQRGLYFWSDFTMFETTHSRESWAFMKELYRRARIDDVDFWKVMEAWEKPSGTIGALKYNAPVMNASGRDDTALANAVLNGFSTYLSATAAYLDKPLNSITVEDVRSMRNVMTLSVCGDDSIGCVPMRRGLSAENFRQQLSDNIRKFGFKAVLYSSDRLEDAVYLGMRPYPTAKGFFWGKTIGRASYKLGWILRRHGRDLFAHHRGICEMHLKCSRHVPVLYDLALKCWELRPGTKITRPVADENKPWEWTFQGNVPYDEITLESVARMYSQHSQNGMPDVTDQEVTVQDVKDLIRAIAEVKALPCVVDHWLWKRIVHADDL